MNGRKMMLIALVFIIGIGCMITGCDDRVSLIATVVEVSENDILVSPVEGASEAGSADRILVSAVPEDVRVGDTVEIIYDGMIAEMYPALITNVYSVTVVNRAE